MHEEGRSIMSTNTRTSKISRQARVQKVIAGIQKYCTGQTLTLGGVSYTASDLITLLQSDTAASSASTAARATLTTEVQAERNSRQKVDPLLRFLKAYVTGQLGDTKDSAQKLDDFGYSPRNVPVKGVDVKTAAADKMRATRAARHTMGSRQKEKVKGTVGASPSADGPTTTAPATVAAPAATERAPRHRFLSGRPTDETGISSV
jgi:hypothetical protein